MDASDDGDELRSTITPHEGRHRLEIYRLAADDGRVRSSELAGRLDRDRSEWLLAA